jgi:hypothetical protein
MKLESVRELKAEVTRELRMELARVSSTRAGRTLPGPVAIEARRIRTMRQAPTVAFGVAPTTSGKEYKLAVRLQRRSATGLLEESRLRERARGEIDVRYVGRILKRTWFTERHRPLQIGMSVGHARITAGTLGGFVKGPRGRKAILSNNHVLADENEGAPGDAILQPGPLDGGLAADRVAELWRFVPLRGGNASNAVDAAAAVIDEGIESEIGALYRARIPLAGIAPEDAEVDRVEKWGRTTGHTRGRVTAFELDNVVVGYDMGEVRFDGQIEIESAGRGSFSDGGDSGSLIMTEGDRLAVALLFAGSQTGGRGNRGLTYANPIHAVLSSLKTDLLASES